VETEEQKKEGGEVEHVGKKLPPRHACRKEAMEHDEIAACTMAFLCFSGGSGTQHTGKGKIFVPR